MMVATKPFYLYWGLILHWAKERKISHNLINARAETIAEKPAYQQRWCLIPATGFYEWQKTGQGRANKPIVLVDKTHSSLSLQDSGGMKKKRFLVAPSLPQSLIS
jgi:putative SOS response-associated peptidase YedK